MSDASMDTMVEKAARALMDHENDVERSSTDCAPKHYWRESDWEFFKEEWLAEARAALVAAGVPELLKAQAR